MITNETIKYGDIVEYCPHILDERTKPIKQTYKFLYFVSNTFYPLASVRDTVTGDSLCVPASRLIKS